MMTVAFLKAVLADLPDLGRLYVDGHPPIHIETDLDGTQSPERVNMVTDHASPSASPR
jgi:hypothetical protein